MDLLLTIFVIIGILTVAVLMVFLLLIPDSEMQRELRELEKTRETLKRWKRHCREM
jgi:predicted MFS family arabinose efflux permease